MNRYALLPLVILLLTGCASITQQQAEQTAMTFINSNVKFFTEGESDERIIHNAYSVSGMTSYQEDKDWVVVAHITANLEGEEKKNDMVVKIDSKGKVIEFNGNPLPT